MLFCSQLRQLLGEHESLWISDYVHIGNVLRTCSKALGFTLVPYMLRHSGPSWDVMQQLRSIVDVQRRGGWFTLKV